MSVFNNLIEERWFLLVAKDKAYTVNLNEIFSSHLCRVFGNYMVCNRDIFTDEGIKSDCLYGPFASSGILLDFFGSYVRDKEQAALVLITLGLFIGFLKTRLVLHKTVKRVVQRIFSLPAPVPFSKMYKPSYYLLIRRNDVAWNGIAFSKSSKRFLLGLIDVAVGSALINGAVLYFRYAFLLRKQKSLEN